MNANSSEPERSKTTPTTTTVGSIDDEVLAYTAGKDVVLDQVLVEVDCLGTAAHVTMLAEVPVDPPLLTADERDAVLAELRRLVATARAGSFEITLADQDVHLAVERQLTEALGDLGKKVHTARSRNDQIALDLRLHARDELAGTIREVVALASAFNAFGEANAAVPMVGRTHMQPAMPSSVGLWATAQTEGLLDDLHPLLAAAKANHRCRSTGNTCPTCCISTRRCTMSSTPRSPAAKSNASFCKRSAKSC